MNIVQLMGGKQLTIRAAKVEDAEMMLLYINQVGGESNNLLFGRDEFHLTLEQEKAFIERINSSKNGRLFIGIIDKEIVSVGNIIGADKKRIMHNANVGISVKKDYWRQGIGEAMMHQLIRFAKEQGDIRNISLGVRCGNEGAIKLYKKLGFEEIGVHRNYFNVDGKLYDEILMDLYLG